MALQPINPADWKGNPFSAIGKDWFLLTAGTKETGYNFMTASWGQMGILWNKPSVTCYVRHSRHTFGFIEQNELFTLSFFDESQRKALSFCGSHSGRDCDKEAETGLHTVTLDGAVTFAEAKLVFVCRKRYAADMDVADLPEDVASSFYATDAPHRLYIGEIIACYVNE